MSYSHPTAVDRKPSGRVHDATHDADAPAVVRDLRGWFYCLIAPSPNCTVLQVGEGFAENWLPNVVQSNLGGAAIAGLAPGQFDFVVIHYTLGGLSTLRAAISSASGLLRRGGLLAIAGENRLRLSGATDAGKDTARPRATGWGFRAMMVNSGFSKVILFNAHPPGSAPAYVVDASSLSSREFFRISLRGRQLAFWSPTRIALKVLVELDLMPFLQPGLLVVGEKC